jgi:hypothetical protein
MEFIMKKFLLILVLLALILPLGISQAQTPGTPEDNACNEGGAMAGKCPPDSEWHWVCGYYMARFYTQSYNQGGYNTSLVPDWCASLLPPRPIPAPAAVSGPSQVVTGGFVEPFCVAAGVTSRPFHALGRLAAVIPTTFTLAWTSSGADSGFAINGNPVAPNGSTIGSVGVYYEFTHNGRVLSALLCATIVVP